MAESKITEIKKMFMERLDLKELDEKVALSDLGLDSLDVVDMCLDVEDQFGIHFETEELTKFKTVKDVFDSIEAKLAK